MITINKIEGSDYFVVFITKTKFYKLYYFKGSVRIYGSDKWKYIGNLKNLKKFLYKLPKNYAP